MNEKIVVIDFGGQYNQLVARRVREAHVYCEIVSYRTPLPEILAMSPKGIILTGGPNSVYEAGAPTAGRELFETGIPVLGLCYGAQLMMQVLGGEVRRAPEREYGKTEVFLDAPVSPLFAGVADPTICWMTIFSVWLRAFGSPRTRTTAPSLPRKTRRSICMRFSFIRRCFTRCRAHGCWRISSAGSAAAAATGGWRISPSGRCGSCGRRSAAARYSAPSPAAWTPRSRRSSLRGRSGKI